MHITDIEVLTKNYGDACLAEQAALLAYEQAQQATAWERIRVTLQAGEDGLLTGKTQADRDQQAAFIVGKSESVGLLEHYEILARVEYVKMSSLRKQLEAEISLVKGWFYAQQGGGN